MSPRATGPWFDPEFMRETPQTRKSTDVSALEKRLEKNMGRAMLICEALWELLQENTNLTEDDLYKKIYEVDSRDGVIDGQNKSTAKVCPNCDRKVSPRHQNCIYCGAIVDKSIFRIE